MSANKGNNGKVGSSRPTLESGVVTTTPGQVVIRHASTVGQVTIPQVEATLQQEGRPPVIITLTAAPTRYPAVRPPGANNTQLTSAPQCQAPRVSCGVPLPVPRQGYNPAQQANYIPQLHQAAGYIPEARVTVGQGQGQAGARVSLPQVSWPQQPVHPQGIWPQRPVQPVWRQRAFAHSPMVAPANLPVAVPEASPRDPASQQGWTQFWRGQMNSQRGQVPVVAPVAQVPVQAYAEERVPGGGLWLSQDTVDEAETRAVSPEGLLEVGEVPDAHALFQSINQQLLEVRPEEAASVPMVSDLI